MPLEAYQRGEIWWAKGRVEYNDLVITDYIRESTGASTERGAEQWIADRETRETRIYLGDEVRHELTFMEAVTHYRPDATTAKYLVPILARFGGLPVKDITPKMVRDVAREIYPENATDTWRRWVITPTRAVINNAHDLGLCHSIKIKGYSKDERLKQDKRRKKKSRVERQPGDWDWLLKFRQHASRRHAALALFMFSTGARIGQSTAMHPDNLKLDEAKAIIPGAKGHDDRVVTLPDYVIEDLRALPPIVPRGWDKRYRANLRVFGFASKDGPRKGWMTACKRADIPYLPPHSAGRHGFGQEMRIRQGVDKEAVGEFGGWSDTALLDKTYTHSEAADAKIHEAMRTGRVQAEKRTGLKVAKMLGISSK